MDSTWLPVKGQKFTAGLMMDDGWMDNDGGVRIASPLRNTCYVLGLDMSAPISITTLCTCSYYLHFANEETETLVR